MEHSPSRAGQPGRQQEDALGGTKATKLRHGSVLCMHGASKGRAGSVLQELHADCQLLVCGCLEQKQSRL